MLSLITTTLWNGAVPNRRTVNTGWRAGSEGFSHEVRAAAEIGQNVIGGAVHAGVCCIASMMPARVGAVTQMLVKEMCVETWSLDASNPSW